MKVEVKNLILQLQNKAISIRDIPAEYKEDPNIIRTERLMGIRENYRCGYDVINDRFFAEEIILSDWKEAKWHKVFPKYFPDFDSYNSFLGGNIYENSCYYMLNPNKVPKAINSKRLFAKKSFINYTVDDFHVEPSLDKQEKYAKSEQRKVLIQKWIETFNQCESYEELKQTVNDFSNSSLQNYVDLGFFFWNYIFSDVTNEKHFKAIIDYISTGENPSDQISNAMCYIYNPDRVVENFNYQKGAYMTRRRHNQEMTELAEIIKNKKYTICREGYFCTNKNFYCVKSKGLDTEGKKTLFECMEYFENLDSFIKRLDGDLTNCDISETILDNYDFSNCFVDETTKLPYIRNESYHCVVRKTYFNGLFKVMQVWKNEKGIEVKRIEHTFDYFCDFVAFLRGDLSDTNLLYCDGFEHVPPTPEINLENARITSNICEKWGIKYDPIELDKQKTILFPLTVFNETQNTLIPLAHDKTSLERVASSLNSLASNDIFSSTKKIFYISDIHLNYLLENKNVKSKLDEIKIVHELVKEIMKGTYNKSIILINGDTSSDFSLFQLFVSQLAKYDRIIIFTLGNHETWSCPDDSIDDITKKYRDVLSAAGMYLLQNNVIFFNEFDQFPEQITEEELNSFSDKELNVKVRSARLIFNREIEIAETKRFEKLYKKVCSAFHNKNTIIMTHMPFPCWYEPAWRHDKEYTLDKSGEMEYLKDHPEDNLGEESAYQPGFFYFSGHTHRNYFYDDGIIRIYADNQFGYNKKKNAAWPHLKYFEVEKSYNYFEDYSDGIHIITADDYRAFYRGKNIKMEFNRDTSAIYMLKRDSYYCFITRDSYDNLCIMNGGSFRRLDRNDIQYYYNNMESVIDQMKSSFLTNYTAYQNAVSKEVVSFGGQGTIHGCIIDIDFWNHIYVNPNDGSLTGYWASDIVNKLVYPSIPALLEEKCPALFASYKHMLQTKSGNLPIISNQTSSQLALKPVQYLETDIYKASLMVSKMQKVNNNILTIWPDNLPNQAEQSTTRSNDYYYPKLESDKT